MFAYKNDLSYKKYLFFTKTFFALMFIDADCSRTYFSLF